MKLYSIEVAIYATAYVQAESPEEANNLLEERLLSSTIQDASGSWFNGCMYKDLIQDPHAVVTLSPCMTPDHTLSEPEQVYP